MTLSSRAQTWVTPDFSAIALRIQSGDAAAESELINGLSRGVHLIACRRLGNSAELNEVVKSVFRIAVAKMRAGDLQDPHCVLGYIQTVLTTVVQQHLDRRTPNHPSAVRAADEQPAIREQEKRSLNLLSEREREVLRRYFLVEQTCEQICEQMGLTTAEFLAIKRAATSKMAFSGAGNHGRFGQRPC